MPSIINATTTAGVAVTGDNSGQLEIQTNSGTTAVTIDTSQNVGIGSASSGNKFEVAGSGMFSGAVTTNTTGTHISYQSSNSQIGAWGPNTSTNGTLVFYSARSNGSNGLERMRIDSNGYVMAGVTSALNDSRLSVSQGSASNAMFVATAGAGNRAIGFINASTFVGDIVTSISSVSYNTSSDYRLKENVAPMTGALAKVALLKPCTYTWKVDGSAGQGFIAHELQEVVSDAVSGEKDAVNEDGSIKPQGVDTSFLVATLTAAIQELNAKVEAQAVRIAELEGAK